MICGRLKIILKLKINVVIPPVTGLYAITPDINDTPILLEKTEQALSGGVKILQYRNKQASLILAYRQVLALRKLTRNYAATLIINDSIPLAQDCDADGVHLGHDDEDFALARQKLPGKLIGVSCYNSIDRAAKAVAAGADYIAFGSFYPSSTKPNAVRANKELIIETRARFTVPIVAIGGITIDNATPLIESGVNAIAIVSALFDTANIAETAKQFTALFDNYHVRYQ